VEDIALKELENTPKVPLDKVPFFTKNFSLENTAKLSQPRGVLEPMART
jgi:hypothetical protein